MSHDQLFISEWSGGDVDTNEQALERLKNQASKSQITLMFDLVMKQVGNKLEKIYANRHLFIDPFKGEFDYSTLEKQIEIFDKFFKLMIERYVVKYGFTGMRIDAVGLVPLEMQRMAIEYFRLLTRENYGCNGFFLGEFLEDNQKLAPFVESEISKEYAARALLCLNQRISKARLFLLRRFNRCIEVFVIAIDNKPFSNGRDMLFGRDSNFK